MRRGPDPCDAGSRVAPGRAGRSGPDPPDGVDRRFADPAWEDNPVFFWLCQSHLVFRRLAEDLVAVGELDTRKREKAAFAVSLLADALAPTNLLLTNPAALKRAFDTGGRSVLAGARNFLGDVRHNGGRPRQVDKSPFRLGENMAATPSKVVFRNHLIELLQYLPQTDEVHAVPLLASPPWINKYYIMDLAPDRSLIEWGVRHGRTVFAISYRNPEASMSGITMDDYATDGMRAALDAVAEITGSETVDIIAVCLGGALATMVAAQLAASGEHRIGTLTLINVLLDYTEPGLFARFIDEGTINKLERRMARKGYLDGAAMGGTFNALRANDLIFSYVVSNWLMGKQPPAFDLLAWNDDTTRLPAAMHSWYLRSCYMENRLANGTMELGGEPLDLGAVTRHIHRRGRARPHSAVALLVQDHPAAEWRRALRPRQRRAHRRHRQPARTQSLGHELRRVPGNRGGVAPSGDPEERVLVGGLVALDGRPRGSVGKTPACRRPTPPDPRGRARRVCTRLGDTTRRRVARGVAGPHVNPQTRSPLEVRFRAARIQVHVVSAEPRVRVPRDGPRRRPARDAHPNRLSGECSDVSPNCRARRGRYRSFRSSSPRASV